MGKNGKMSKSEYNVNEIIKRLEDRHSMMNAAIRPPNTSDSSERSDLLSTGAAAVLQQKDTPSTSKSGEAEQSSNNEANMSGFSEEEIARATKYRLAMADLFVEKAQYHLEHRADRYKLYGFMMYSAAIIFFMSGAYISVRRMLEYTSLVDVKNLNIEQSILWIDLLTKFILGFTAYGFIVLKCVVFARGARACLDQRERLLSKRHSLRQGRLYLHLTGGNVTIKEMESAFNWNHSQTNAFTHMPIDSKAPWGNVAGEAVKIVPELVKVGADAARKGEKSSQDSGSGECTRKQ